MCVGGHHFLKALKGHSGWQISPISWSPCQYVKSCAMEKVPPLSKTCLSSLLFLSLLIQHPQIPIPGIFPLLLPVQTGYFLPLPWCIISFLSYQAWHISSRVLEKGSGLPLGGVPVALQGADSVASISTGHMLGLAREQRATPKALRPLGVGTWNRGIRWYIRTHLSKTKDSSCGDTEAQKDMRNV